jgi:hypothetical protein
MYLFFIECFLLAAGCGTIAVVYRWVLAYEKIMGWWFHFGNRFEGRWFFPPIWGCHKCISGQMGLWFYVFLEIFRGFEATNTLVLEIFRHIFGLLLTICMAIFTAILLAAPIKNIENR